MTKLGIFGGTFSPPHVGHVRAAEAFLNSAKLDKLLIMPAFLPPHKAIDGEASADERFKMCKFAFSGLPRTEISDFEIKNGGKSYTHFTLSSFKDEETELYFLVGTDMFLTLGKWVKPETIFSLATIALVRRERTDENSHLIEERAREYKERFGAKLLFIDADITEISSSDLRSMIKSGADTSEFLSEEVYTYIKENLIYKSDFTDAEIENLRKKVKLYLSDERYAHTLGVENAVTLIADACLPHKKSALRVAALLHDIAKEIPTDEKLAVLKKIDGLTDEDLKSEKLYHAFCAPLVIKRDFPEYATKDVLSAVFNHTTGAPSMTLFDEIVFVADYVEEGRSYRECREAREKLFGAFGDCIAENINELHKCALSELEATKAHVLSRKAVLNLRSEAALSYFKTIIQ